MKLVLDTNVLVAALNFDGVCKRVFEDAVERHELFSSPALIEELKRALHHSFKWPKDQAELAAAELELVLELVAPQPLKKPVCRDKDDDQVIAAALAGHCAAVISGDQDLLVLVSYQGLRFISPSKYWDFLAE